MLTLALLGLAACGPLPRPFQPERKGGNELLVLPDSAGIAVAAVTGAVPDGPAMAEAMAAALRKQNVPAGVGVGNRATRWVIGSAEPLNAPPGRVRRAFTWELYGPAGDSIGETRSTVELPAEAWRAADPEALQAAAARAAPDLAAMLQGSTVRATELPGYPAGTRIVVEPVEGGGSPALARALTAAMIRQLRDRDLPVADRAQTGDIVVQGTLSLGAPGGGRRPLELVWTVRREGRDGTLGDLRQANPVQVSQVTETPERLAGLIVQAALPGLMRVLDSGAQARR